MLTGFAVPEKSLSLVLMRMPLAERRKKASGLSVGKYGEMPAASRTGLEAGLVAEAVVLLPEPLVAHFALLVTHGQAKGTLCMHPIPKNYE
jgi:hypothetical protein